MLILEYSMTNVGRIKAVSVKPKPAGLTVIGGRNRAGKTTNLDMLAWLFGGDRYRPAEPNRRGSKTPADLDVHTDNGLHITRKGKNGDLTVIDESTGEKGNQTLLDKCLTAFALDLRAFRNAKGKQKCEILLRTLGIDADVAAAQTRIDEAYDERKTVNRVMHQKEAALAQASKPEEPPIDEPIDVDVMVAQLQEYHDGNAWQQQQANRQNLLRQSIGRDLDEIKRLEALIGQLKESARAKTRELESIPEPLPQVDTSKLQADIADANTLNAQFARVVQQRQEYQRLSRELAEARQTAETADAAVETARQAKMDLLNQADMPDPDIGVTDEGELTYKGDPWEALAGSDEMILCCKIVSKLNPECRFVLVDGLEQMDLQTLADFDAWAEKEGLQVIGTRVSTGDECSIIIEDGEVAAAA